MIKKQKAALGFLVISITAALWLINKLIPDQTVSAVSEEKLKIIFTEIKEQQKIFDPSTAAVAVIKIEEQFTTKFKKCFPADTAKKEDLISFFEKKSNLSSPHLELEQYELKSSTDEQIIVQMVPGEELKDQVRAFLISKADGLPDRIHHFPQAKAEISKRLQGALTLGQLIQKNETTHQDGTLGELLEIEKNKDQILRVRYSEPGLEFSCDENKCECFKLK